MITKLDLGNGRFLVPVKVLSKDMTQEESDYVRNTLIPGLTAQYPQCFIDTVKLGWKVFSAVIVEGDRDLYDFYVSEMDAEQKREVQEKRCIIPDGKGSTRRCPLRLPNPNFDSNRKEDKVTNPKTVKNSCENCPYDTFDKPNYSNLSIEGLTRQNDDGEEIPFEIGVPMESEASRYLKMCKAVLSLISTKYPKRLDEFVLRLDGANRKEVAKELKKNQSSVYKLGRHLEDDLNALLDTLIDFNR